MPSKQSPGRKVTKAEIAEWLMRGNTNAWSSELTGERIWYAGINPLWDDNGLGTWKPEKTASSTKFSAIRRAILAERQTRKGKG